MGDRAKVEEVVRKLHEDACDVHCEPLLARNPEWVCERRAAIVVGVRAGLELAAEADEKNDDMYNRQYVDALGKEGSLAPYWEGYCDARTDLRASIRALAGKGGEP